MINVTDEEGENLQFYDCIRLMDYGKDLSRDFIRVVRLLLVALFASAGLMAAMIFWAGNIWQNRVPPPVKMAEKAEKQVVPAAKPSGYWTAPDLAKVTDETKALELRYGRELIAHTARYLGPGGSVLKISNGMNCQNCHLDAGTKTFGNNYAAVASTYPKFRARSGSVESIEKRVNDCFERSLNGEALDNDSREMKAIVSYIQWLGSEVPKGQAPKGAGLAKMETMDRAADPDKGKALYETQCTVCHGKNGEGVKTADGNEYQFPPLWGKDSYNQGAGLYRISTFARYIRANMPLGATHDNPILTEEQSWDIAAYVNSLPRPAKDISKDWPDISLKPVDHPFGPYADPFSETQHKYGPYEPIVSFYADKKANP